jgi:hypothetical protein
MTVKLLKNKAFLKRASSIPLRKLPDFD